MPPSGMPDHLLLHLGAIVLYLAAGMTAWLRLTHERAWTRTSRLLLISFAVAGLCLHMLLLYQALYVQDAIDLGLSSVTSLVSWAVTLIFLATMIRKPIENLAVVIMPLAALGVLLAWLWPSPARQASGSVWLFAHLIISILAYSLLSIAMLQGVVMAIQERRLHQKRTGKMSRVLPPLQTMETLMFQMLAIGFALLTLTLVSGIFFSEQLFNRPLVWSHHIVLALFAWAVFGILLIGRWRFGWRGQNAVRWTLGGFVLLLLAYLGTRFVLEVAFGR